MNFILKLLAVLALLPFAVNGVLTILFAILIVFLIGMQIAKADVQKGVTTLHVKVPQQVCLDPRTPHDKKTCKLIAAIREADAAGKKSEAASFAQELHQHLLSSNPNQQPITQRQIEEQRQGNPNWHLY